MNKEKLKTLLETITENHGVQFEIHDCATKGTLATIYATAPDNHFHTQPDDRAILTVLQQERGRVKRADLTKLQYAAWTQYKKQVVITEVYFDTQEVYVEIQDRYNISDYVDDYTEGAAAEIAFEIDQNKDLQDFRTAAEADDFDLQSYMNDKGVDYWELLDNARPDFYSNYEVLRFVAENWTDMDLDEITRNGGDFMDNLRYAAVHAIEDMVDQKELLQRVKDKVNGK